MDYLNRNPVVLPDTIKNDLVWGRKGIAHFIGVSVDRFDRLAKTDAPIQKRGGVWVASKSSLMNWLMRSD